MIPINKFQLARSCPIGFTERHSNTDRALRVGATFVKKFLNGNRATVTPLINAAQSAVDFNASAAVSDEMTLNPMNIGYSDTLIPVMHHSIAKTDSATIMANSAKFKF